MNTPQVFPRTTCAEPLIRTVCFKVHQYCDLACLHCWSESSPKATQALSHDVILSLATSLRQFGLSHVSLSGGEPLLFPGLERVLQGLWDLDLIVTITTNGFNEKVLSRMLEFIRLHGLSKTRLRVSIDGSPARHEYLRGPGTYSRAMRAVGTVRAIFNWVGVNTVVTSATLEGIEKLCADLIEAKVDHWALITEAPRGNLAGSSMSPREVFAAMGDVEATARRQGFVSSIEKWNYLTAPHSYLLVEPNGRIVIPGTTEDEDILVGEATSTDLRVLEATLRDIAGRENLTFFTWDHRPYFR